MGGTLYKNSSSLIHGKRKEPVLPALFLLDLDYACFLQGGEGAVLLDVAHTLS